jgi:tetratricopeptide (TPR) repeat protein
MLRIIKEVEPPKPSTKLSSSAELPAIAASRKSEPRTLTKQVRGDLDWIVMKCLEKGRARRYETANGLAADLGRYLADEPVLARPPSWTDRWARWKRRHPRAVAAYTTGKWLAGLLALLGVIAYHNAHDATVYRHMHRRSQEDSLARQEALSLTTDLMRGVRRWPQETQDLLRAELDRQADQIDQRHLSSARARELLHEQAARCYEELGAFARAETHWRRSIELNRPVDPDEPAGLFSVIRDDLAPRRLALAKALVHQGKPAEAEEVLLAAREGLSRTDQWNRDRGWDLHGVSSDAVFVALELSDIYVSSQRYGMAEAVLLPTFAAALPATGEGYSFEYSVKGTGLFGLLDVGHQTYTRRVPNSLRRPIADRLARLYDAWGNPDEAARWRMEAEALNGSGKDSGK